MRLSPSESERSSYRVYALGGMSSVFALGSLTVFTLLIPDFVVKNPALPSVATKVPPLEIHCFNFFTNPYYRVHQEIKVHHNYSDQALSTWTF